MEIVKWRDILGQEHILMEGKGDDIFHAMPYKTDDEGSTCVEMLSKKAMMEMVNKLQSK